MLALRIQAANIRQFEELELFFPTSGIILFSGTNGAGKSTIFNLIDWILNGKYQKISHQKLKTHNTPDNAEAFGIFDFIFNGEFYRVRRDLVNSKKRNYVQKGNHIVAEGTTNINAYIRNLLKMDQESFRTCIYASQKDFSNLTNMGDSPRAAMVSKLFRFETIDDASKEARDERKLLDIEVQDAKKQLINPAELEAELNQLTEKEQIKSEALTNQERQIEKLTKQLESKEIEKKEYDTTYEVYRNLLADISNLEIKKQTLSQHSLKASTEKLTELHNKQKRLEQISEKKGQYFLLSQQKEELNAKKESFTAQQNLQKQLNDSNTRIKQYQKIADESNVALLSLINLDTDINQLNQSISQFELSIDEKKGNARELQTILSLNKKQYQELVSEQTEFNKMGTDVPCPTCKRPLGEHLKQHIDDMNLKRQALIRDTAHQTATLNKLNSDIATQTNTLKEQKESLKSLQLKSIEKSRYTNNLENANHEISEHQRISSVLSNQLDAFPEDIYFDETKFQRITAELKELSQIYEEILLLEQQVKEIPFIEKDIKELTSEIDDTENKIRILEKEKSSLNFNKEIHNILLNDIQGIRKELEVAREEKYQLHSILNQLQAQKVNLVETTDKNLTLQTEIQSKTNEMMNLTKLDELFKAYKQDKLVKLAPILSERMSEMLDDATLGLYSDVMIDENYGIHIYNNSEYHPLEIFSGGEQDLAALIQRIAVSQILVEQKAQTNFQMIALDEVTSSFDEARQDSVLSMLKGLNKVFKQILLVSHHEYIKENADHTLNIERTIKNKSIATWSLKDGVQSFNIEETNQLINDNLPVID